MITGFIIGKFYPLHLGHMYLIDVARAQCDHLIVWVCEKGEQAVLGHIRANWIKELYPDVEVRLVPDTLGDDDTAAWAKYTLRVLGRAPDIVFSSEDYGLPYATLMGSRHVLVDRARLHVPISGTKVRSDTFANWSYLSPPARAYFASRISVVGAESTGTTTLAEALAYHYQTQWVKEYGREYCAKAIKNIHTNWTTNEFVHIAAEQVRREDELARSANRILICDTNARATNIWHKRYMNQTSPYITKIASARNYDLTIVTGDEIPFVQDGTRDGEHIRHDMHQWLTEDLKNSQTRFMIVSGTREERLSASIKEIDKLLSTNSRV